jgi:hypothetical protein
VRCSSSSSVFGSSAVALLLALSACNDSKGYSEPGPRPQIVDVTAPASVECNSALSGGACPLQIGVTFRLPEDQFVWKAYVRFQADGSDFGVDRGYLLPNTYGLGDTQDVVVGVSADVPPSLVGSETLHYTVRLVTGAGEHSEESAETVTVSDPSSGQ